MSKVLLRPIVSAKDPKAKDPSITPNMKIVIENGAKYALSQMRSHSEI